MNYKLNDVKLGREMYSECGKSFTQVLEGLDPSENYRGTAYEGLDAYQRQLKRFDIKVRGAGSDSVEKFFSTCASAVLFPEYVARSVRAGMEEGNVLPDITATVTTFDGMDYRSIYSENDAEDKSHKFATDDAAIPVTTIKDRSNLVSLNKHGRMLVASYEAIRFQRLDLFSVLLRQIGAQIMRMHLEDAIGVILNGDGNGNAAKVFTVGDSTIGGAAGKLSYSDLLAFWNTLEPYAMNTLLVAPDVMMKLLLNLPEFHNPMTGFNLQGTGKMMTPLGAKLIRTSAVPAGTIIGLDKGYAIEMVSSKGVSVDYDRLIDKQLERTEISSISGFAKLYEGASKALKIA